MRTKYAIFNSVVGILSQIILAISNIVLRKVFVETIGLDYLGVNGLFGNVLSFLALTESGVGIAMAYSLYEPIAKENFSAISALMQFYKKIYSLIGWVIAVLGLLLLPLMPYLINESPFSNVQIYLFFLFFLGNNVASYYLAYRTTFLNACQKNYIITLFRTATVCLTVAVQAAVLVIWKSFIGYLIVAIASTLCLNISVSIYAVKHYPYISSKTEEKVGAKEKSSLIKNIKGLFWHKIGAFVVFGTDNIIISSLINLKTVGIYSNYMTILSQLNNLSSQVFNAIIPGIGNYIATIEEDNLYDMYKNVLFINFVIFSIFTSVLYAIIQPFMVWWIGSQGLLSNAVTILLLINFYLNGMRNTVQIFKTAGGVFYQDRLSPVIEAISNIIISIWLTHKLGIAGVVLGTIASGLLAPFWISPYYLFRDLMKKPFWYYLYDMIKYGAVLFVMIFGAAIVSKVSFTSIIFLNIILQAIATFVLDVVLGIIIFGKSPQFQYFLEKILLCFELILHKKG